jgi:excisionase family DNA binding protein
MNSAVEQLFYDYLRVTDNDKSAAANLTLADVMQSTRGTDRNMVTHPDQNLNVTEVANHIHISQRKVYELVAQGLLGHFRVGRAIRFRLEDIEKYQQQQQTAKSATILSKGVRPLLGL